ncbi:TetR family transcriptional regulator [Thermosporothrix hazakensis]|jgi:AcrR family transcriptional regulator|uniref:TetR family transcriptional regulator n=1 Tax=Thermosporothrix hazakensis TaxID=644383 RepID=A0A326TUI1_THEHA|nr:TetR/AcrR family transcriptional regulator [Thermosporothrix hazakensis]PZW19716.1 TetR family transcriptional regulator [Thermosporothrix hazakensis]GCE48585.1 TetR family transcriptional regulator [Thermosporothrix hazakensis]
MTDPEQKPTSPRRRPGGRSARIRAAVMEATMQMLKDRGIEGLNVAEIAARVGIPESTIYRRWKSREGLVVETVLARMNDTIPLPDTGSFRSDLHALLQQSASFLESPDGLLLTRSMFSTMNRTDSEARQLYWQTRFSHLGTLVQRAIERNEVRPDTDPGAFITAMTGALYVRMLVLEAPLDAAFLDQLEQMFLQGVLKQDKKIDA